MTTFVGVSSVDQRTGTCTLQNRGFAARDLLNHFHTRRGERLGDPDFGSVFPELLFQPLVQGVINEADDDIRRVVGFDPRRELPDYQLAPGDKSITAAMQLRCIPDLSEDKLVPQYEEDTA